MLVCQSHPKEVAIISSMFSDNCIRSGSQGSQSELLLELFFPLSNYFFTSDSASRQALGGISDLGMNKEFGRYCGKADLAVT